MNLELEPVWCRDPCRHCAPLAGGLVRTVRHNSRSIPCFRAMRSHIAKAHPEIRRRAIGTLVATIVFTLLVLGLGMAAMRAM